MQTHGHSYFCSCYHTVVYIYTHITGTQPQIVKLWIDTFDINLMDICFFKPHYLLHLHIDRQLHLSLNDNTQLSVNSEQSANSSVHKTFKQTLKHYCCPYVVVRISQLKFSGVEITPLNKRSLKWKYKSTSTLYLVMI